MAKEKIEGVTVEGVALEVYLEEQESNEIEKVKNRELAGISRSVRQTIISTGIGNISGKRSEYSNRVEKLSPEIIAHTNYLFQVGGEKLVNDFLSKPITPDGTIESAIKDAKEKVAFYTKQQVTAAAERGRWEEAAKRLQEAYNLVTGKASIPLPSNGTKQSQNLGMRAAGAKWPDVYKELLVDGPMHIKILRGKIEARFPDMKPVSIYQAVRINIRIGVLEEDDDGVLTYIGK